MKKLIKFLGIALIFLIGFAIFDVVYSYKKQLTTESDLGSATGKYISEYDVYPEFLSSYLFEKYERENLYKVQMDSPEPYLFFINASYDLSDDASDLKVDRFTSLESDLICIGLSPARFDTYLERINVFKGPSEYLLNKYKSFDYETLSKYCSKKPT
ncbi:hypothetical protein [Acinetobacter haemolyticus]|uniref:hypothetical protein n=1 Tax=Acinetobacter haemolyticus TaxID=29430 RepID=UPI00094930C1|nr:hypothetical protein [Acinetobacter haemolyticus]APR69354.1 hypothetical protein AHTJS_02430 [Acinetobacter haemolyticus]ATZ66351.1 hypothetical protein BSR56_02600 [Acinetobacter haemolyticus]NAR19140.1 hypothetical protein [Acinetobacter haemolyticus]NAR29899.1 hypothetical protein [Acinetobacter haemolyticus]NAR36936.1 hypothetical protein [Acinetobacter haemolyticus]